MQVPLFDNTRQFQNLRESLLASAERVLASGKYILGPDVELFEQETAHYLGVEHAIGVASGTDALWIALRALGIGPGDYVLTSPFTFFATASAILTTGAKPALADIDSHTFNLNVEKCRAALEGRSEVNERLGIPPESIKAIIPVHLYGQSADLDELLDLANDYGLFVVEDAAQAFGADYKKNKVGGFGHLGCYSFFPTKSLGGFGDGGLVVTQSEELAARARLLRAHGAKPKYFHHVAGGNSRLDTLQASMLRVKLPHIDEWIKQRQSHAASYNESLASTMGISLPHHAPDRNHTYHQYTIRVLNNQRDALQKHLKNRGVGSEVYYPLPMHLQSVLITQGYLRGDFPNAELACSEALSLPIFPEMRSDERGYVADAVREFASLSIEDHELLEVGD